MQTLPHLGVGLGYRVAHHDEIIRHRDALDFLEVITDQFIYADGEKLDRLFDAAADLPLVPHGLAMSIGTATSVDPDYLARTAELVKRVHAPWFSDHLCLTRVPEIDVGSLTPLWFTEEVVENVVRNIKAVKEAVPDTPFLIENIAYYFSLPGNEMSEAEFITRILERADCGLLLDLENLHINSQNLDFDPCAFLNGLPLERVEQIHIAGHRPSPEMVVDNHDSPVSPEVWNLLEYVVRRSAVKGILLERDDESPPFSMLVEELEYARRILANR